MLLQTGTQWQHYTEIRRQRRYWIIDRTLPSVDDTPPNQLQQVIPMDIVKRTTTEVTLTIPDTPVPPQPTSTILLTWQQYISHLSHWEKGIINDVTTDIQYLWKNLTIGDQHWKIISDGSYADLKSAYSWIIYDGKQQIQKCTGMTPGNPATAFRAELYGVLSWYCCLFHVLQYFEIRSKVQITPFTDNTKVIHYHQCMRQDVDLKQPFVDDYDLYSHIHYFHNQIGLRGIQIHPIHKIDNAKSNDIDIQITMRIHQQVDKNAKHHRQHHPQIWHEIIPKNSAYLSNSDGLITSNEKIIMETTRNTYTIEQYYADRWGCPISNISHLDWRNYTSLYNSSRSTLQIFMIKILTGWLPVKHQTNKMTQATQKCHQCNQEETIAHLFQCPKRHKWKNTFLTKLSQHLQSNNTPQEASDVVVSHITTLLTNRTDHEHFRHFTIFAGLLPKTWKDSYNMQQQRSTTTRTIWIKKLSRWLLQQGYDLWMLRNQSIHENDKSKSTIEYALNQKIRQLYSLQHEIGYHDRELFSQHIDDRLALPYHQKMTWITNTTKTLKVSMEDFQRKQHTGQKDIRQYFTKQNKSH